MKLRRAYVGFAGVPPPSYVLDELFASLDPLRSRLAQVWVTAQTAYAPDSTKGAWLSSLTQASNMLERASIEGEAGQKLAMGDLTVPQWASGPENAADLVEYVGREVGLASYSVSRLWREVVVPTAEQVAQKVPEIAQQAVSWGPYVAAGLLVLFVVSHR